MLEPRGSDIPVLFLVFVVLPLVSFFLLGKWSETAKRNERASVIAQEAADETESGKMAVGICIPEVRLPNNEIRRCAKCFGPAKTRCSQCKSIWYCSGGCQIIHWRQAHKLECGQFNDSQRSSFKPILSEGYCVEVPHAETVEQFSTKYNIRLPSIVNATSEDGAVSKYLQDVIKIPHPSFPQLSQDAYLKGSDSVQSDNFPCAYKNEDDNLRVIWKESSMIETESNAFENRSVNGVLNSSTTTFNGTAACNTEMDFINEECSAQEKILSRNRTSSLHCCFDSASVRGSNKSRTVSHSHGILQQKSPISREKVSKEWSSSGPVMNQAGHCVLVHFNGRHSTLPLTNNAAVATIKDDTTLQENGLPNMACMRLMGRTKSGNTNHLQHLEDKVHRQRKLKMIFPYEEFVNCFHYEAFNMIPRGLVNCGNSCYANAVLQCLTSTKPLIVYLLCHSHSKSGCDKDRCLLCELEQLVVMQRDSGGPLSPVTILRCIRSHNSQIGHGSQEDAHEFLRLVVTSMQSICLKGFGGENIDSRLQDTTFIQHTFRGRLRSKVKCLRCNHESERYENMMDLTLEISGWVESVEDAMTQFTSPEDLDGENMYRCARCAAYVRARKQLNIQEAPNILTVVLKRFQEGKYGKINKHIAFSELLDMVPFMTGIDDIPPLYILYGVVVHLDTSNASFFGHYISYVKDMKDNWFCIDDTEVTSVDLSQVMSEGAYILFYMRSSPRPANARKATHSEPKQVSSRIQMSSAAERRRPNHSIPAELLLDNRLEINAEHSSTSGGILIRETILGPSTLRNYAEFSDGTSGDWSLFTSSDDSSFTTESTRDSFSTVDDAGVPFSTVFQFLYPAVRNSTRSTISRNMLSCSKPRTRFAREDRGFIPVSYLPTGEPAAGSCDCIGPAV